MWSPWQQWWVYAPRPSTNTAPPPLPLLLQKPPPSLPIGCVSFKLDLDSACGVTPAVTTCTPAMLTLLGNGRPWSTDLFPGSPSTRPALSFIALVLPFYWFPSRVFASKTPKKDLTVSSLPHCTNTSEAEPVSIRPSSPSSR